MLSISVTMHIFIYSHVFVFLGVLNNMQIVAQIAEAQCEVEFEYDEDFIFTVRLTHWPLRDFIEILDKLFWSNF